jgi:hypothetical protein
MGIVNANVGVFGIFVRIFLLKNCERVSKRLVSAQAVLMDWKQADNYQLADEAWHVTAH